LQCDIRAAHWALPEQLGALDLPSALLSTWQLMNDTLSTPLRKPDGMDTHVHIHT